MKKYFYFLIFSISVSATACPLGPGDSELTFSRVMQNFGRLLIKSDSIVRAGQSAPWELSAKDIQEALDGINGAISCAQKSLESKDKSLLPKAAQNLSGDALKVYRTKFNKYMAEFKAILEKHQALFETNLKVDPSARNFKTGVVIERQIREKAAEAHEAL